MLGLEDKILKASYQESTQDESGTRTIDEDCDMPLFDFKCYHDKIEKKLALWLLRNAQF